MICADAWPANHAESLKQQGADVLISSASWAPGEYGPGDTWEKRSGETGLPLFVANRTGKERQLDLTKAASVYSVNGERRVTHQSEGSRVVLLGWSIGVADVRHEFLPVNQ